MKSYLRAILLSIVLVLSGTVLPIDNHNFLVEAKSESMAVDTTLEDGLVTKSDKLTFDLFAKDSNGAKISPSYISVMNNDKPVSVNWDDDTKTSYTLDLSVGENEVVIFVDLNGETLTKNYLITREEANVGDVIGQYVFAIEGFSIGLDYIVEPVLVDLKMGQSASYALHDELSANGFEYDHTGSLDSAFYLSTLLDGENQIYKKTPEIPEALLEFVDANANGYWEGELGEFDFNSMSGWMYSVNNVFPNVGFADFYLKDKDVMRVQFTIAYGSDLGGGWGSNFFASHDKGPLTTEIAKINSSDKKDIYLADPTIKEQYDKSLNSLYRVDAVQKDLNENVLILNGLIKTFDKKTSMIEELEELISDIDRLDLTNRTDSELERLETNVTNARSGLETGMLTVEEIESLIQNLVHSIDRLAKTADLDKQVQDSKKIDLSDKTEESKQAFEAALNHAETLLSQVDLTEEAINAALQELFNAIDNLEEIPVDMSLLEEKVAEALGIDTSTKTDESVEVFNKALEMAKEVLAKDTATQSEVDQALKTLNDAFDNLEDKQVDKSRLSETITKAKAVSKEGKTEESITALNNVIADAEKVLEDSNASEDEVVAKINALENAMLNLQDIPKEIVDKTDLAKQIEQAEKLVEDNYTESSFTQFKIVLGEAKVVLNSEDVSQAEVDEIVGALKEAESKLVVKDEEEEDVDEPEENPTDLIELKAVIEQAEKLDVTNKTEASNQVLEASLEQGYQVLQKENPTENEVETALKAILDAIKGLEDEVLAPHIAYIEELAPITVEFATKESELNLPKSITLHLSDKTQREVAITSWSLKTNQEFNSEIPEDYIFTAGYGLPSDVNGEKLPVEITVTVKEEIEIMPEKPEDEMEQPEIPEEDDKEDLEEDSDEELTDPLDKKDKDEPVESDLKESNDELKSSSLEHNQNNASTAAKDESDKSQENKIKALPKTATNLFNILIVGFGILSIGLFFFFKKRRNVL